MNAKSRDELETVIRASANDKTWDVFSETPRILHRMTKLFGSGRKVSEVGFRWQVPRACITIRQPARPRVMSEQQRLDAAARLRKIRKTR